MHMYSCTYGKIRSKWGSWNHWCLESCIIVTTSQYTEIKVSLGLNPEKVMAPHSSTLAGKSHRWKSLVGCSPWGREESDTTEWLDFHFSLSFIGEGNDNPLQCSCLENPRDGGSWWAAVYGVAQSWTWLKQLSSSSSRLKSCKEIYPE